MKLPNLIIGVDRKKQSEDLQVVLRSHGEAKVIPQDVWCEDTCHQIYDVGSAAHDKCLNRCRRN